jgi:hypothetical protein
VTRITSKRELARLKILQRIGITVLSYRMSRVSCMFARQRRFA